MAKHSKVWRGVTVGVDVSDRESNLCFLDADGEVIERSKIPTTLKALKARFLNCEPVRVVLETGTHANWMHDALEAMKHDVIVADARELKAITESDRKADPRDAYMLGRMGRSELDLIREVDPRSPEVRKDLEVLRARAKLVVVRTMLVNHIRGVVKSFGGRMPSCSAESMHKQTLPTELQHELAGMMELLSSTTAQIKAYDKQIAELGETKYPQTQVLRQVPGVGPITALCFVLIVGVPGRFTNTRDVASYIGLTPKRRQSGDKDPHLGISKRGDAMLRMLLVQGSQHILRQSSPDCDLKRFGTRLIKQGGRYPKQRAVVATARKLSVLLLALLKTGEVYEPLRNSAKTENKS